MLAIFEAKIEKINQIQTALEDAALNSASRNGIEEYMLDDDQVKIKTIYRSVDEIVASIEGFEKIKQRLINRVQGHVMLHGRDYVILAECLFSHKLTAFYVAFVKHHLIKPCPSAP